MNIPANEYLSKRIVVTNGATLLKMGVVPFNTNKHQGDFQKRISRFFERGRGLAAPSFKKSGYSFSEIS